MEELELPPRRSVQAAQSDKAVIKALEEMFRDNETITARALARRLTGLSHASSLTRDAWRAACLEKWQSKQQEMRHLIEHSDKTSKANLTLELEKKRCRIQELEQQVALLIASHRAMILAVGEMGGMRAWSRFFESYTSVTEELRRMGALQGKSDQAHMEPSDGTGGHVEK